MEPLESRRLLDGQLVRLSAWEPATDAEAYASWHRDPAYLRLSSDQVAKPMGVEEAEAQLRAWSTAWPESVNFAVRTHDDDRLVGIARIYDLIVPHQTGMLGLSIAPDEWGRGFGTDALALIIAFGFHELGLHRVWFDVFAYNERALRMYERYGFREEGRLREHLYRDGQRWDVVFMGMLREEFDALHG